MTPETWNQIISAGITIGLALLVPLLTAGINVLLKKAKLDQNAAVQATVRSAIALAEEQGAAYLRVQGSKLNPSVKLNLAVERVLAKVPGVTADEAKALVQEQLPQVGLGAAGFLDGVARAVTR